MSRQYCSTRAEQATHINQQAGMQGLRVVKGVTVIEIYTGSVSIIMAPTVPFVAHNSVGTALKTLVEGHVKAIQSSVIVRHRRTTVQ